MNNKNKEKNKIINNKKYIVIIIVLMMLVISLVISNLVLYNSKNNYKCNNKCDYYNMKISKNENIVFLGDSITDQYPTDELFAELPVVNSGAGGYTTDNILDEMNDRVYKYNPTKVFILIGTNDIGNDGKDENYVFNNIKKIVDNIKKNRPKAIIYVESVYPVSDNDENMIERNKVIDKLNKKIKDYYSNKNVTYIDINSYLKNNKNALKSEYTKDGIHLTDRAYLKITKLLFPYIYD